MENNSKKGPFDEPLFNWFIKAVLVIAVAFSIVVYWWPEGIVSANLVSGFFLAPPKNVWHFTLNNKRRENISIAAIFLLVLGLITKHWIFPLSFGILAGIIYQGRDKA